MKKKRWRFGALLLALVLLCSACTIQSTNTPQNEAHSPADTRDERIALLEAELAQMREKERDYQSKISALETRISQLSATKDTVDDTDPLAERVTFYYREESGTAVITGYSGNTAILTVPAHLDGLPVTAIGEHAFERASLTAVILPEGLTSIGWFAFYECPDLSGVTLPSTISSIGYAVFDGCPSLTLRCPAGSYAEQYAQSYAIPYTND